MKESIGLILDDVIKDIRTEKKILEKLKSCRDTESRYFFTFFFHINLSPKQLKAFVKRNTDILFKLNADITKQYNKRVFFMIKPLDNFEAWKISFDNYRYMYYGDMISGIEKYSELIHYIDTKRGRR